MKPTPNTIQFILPQANGAELKAVYRLISEALPAELGLDLHVCRPAIWDTDPAEHGYKDNQAGLLEKAKPELSNCSRCGAKPSQFRYDTMTEHMEGFNACLGEVVEAIKKLMEGLE